MYLCSEISHKYVFIMARPIRETPVLKGEDAFNFEMRRLEVEHMSKEQRAENLRKVITGGQTPCDGGNITASLPSFSIIL